MMEEYKVTGVLSGAVEMGGGPGREVAAVVRLESGEVFLTSHGESAGLLITGIRRGADVTLFIDAFGKVRGVADSRGGRWGNVSDCGGSVRRVEAQDVESGWALAVPGGGSFRVENVVATERGVSVSDAEGGVHRFGEGEIVARIVVAE